MNMKKLLLVPIILLGGCGLSQGEANHADPMPYEIHFIYKGEFSDYKTKHNNCNQGDVRLHKYHFNDLVLEQCLNLDQGKTYFVK